MGDLISRDIFHNNWADQNQIYFSDEASGLKYCNNLMIHSASKYNMDPTGTVNPNEIPLTILASACIGCGKFVTMAEQLDVLYIQDYINPFKFSTLTSRRSGPST